MIEVCYKNIMPLELCVQKIYDPREKICIIDTSKSINPYNYILRNK
jgi:hypothetical protein